MKYLKKILYILCLFVVTVYPFLSVYGDNVVLNNYKQVSSLGGENWEGKDSGKSKDDSSVIISKTISETDYKSGNSNLENYFDITLRVQTRTKAEEPDLAVVIVMDISNTMSYVFNGTKKTRISAAQDAAKKFITEFANRSSSNKDIKRQIGFVAFNTDAKEIFTLQPCMDTTTATNLIKDMNYKTNKIMNAAGYGGSHSRFTNIEAGLKMANDMLSESNASSKHIIFLSDGFPTTYISSGYSGYDPYDSTGKIFYDHVSKKKCLYGTSYSDKAAIKAREEAEKIKNNGINIYSIGVDVGGQKIKAYVDQTNGQSHSVVDRTSTTYEIGSDSNPDAYKN